VRNVLRQWRELSFEKKLGLVIVPLLVAAIGVTVPILTSGHGSSEPTGALVPAAKENLQIEDLTVSGGDPNVPINKPLKPTTVEVTVRNAGNLVSVIKRIAFSVRAFDVVRGCQVGGGLEPSKNYDVVLPAHPQIGQVLTYVVKQAVPAKSADDFTVRLDLQEPARQDRDAIYQLDVLLFHDQAQKPLRAGTVLVSVPFVPRGEFWSQLTAAGRKEAKTPDNVAWKQCLMRNEETYKRMLQLAGERSPLMTLAWLRRESIP
jgi:hypothetical protein